MKENAMPISLETAFQNDHC